jgi:hypothetical protein
MKIRNEPGEDRMVPLVLAWLSGSRRTLEEPGRRNEEFEEHLLGWSAMIGSFHQQYPF